MSSLLEILVAGSAAVRVIALAAVAVATLLATLSWATRTRRLNPFGPLARFTRSHVDPRLAPIERRLLYSGMSPVNAPWWAVLLLVAFALLAIFVVDTGGRMIAQSAYAVRGGPGAVLRMLVGWALGLLKLALIVRVIVSWLPVAPTAWWHRWSVRLTEWFLAPLRRVLPRIGMIDLSPLVAYLGLSVLGSLL